MVDEDQNQENIFKGFGEGEADGKKDKYKYIVPAVGIVIVLGLFIYLISTMVGNDPTTMAVSDLDDSDGEKLAAMGENEALLDQIIISADGDSSDIELRATTEEVEGGTDSTDTLSELGVARTTLTETTITNYLSAISKVIELRTASKDNDLVKTAALVTDLKLYIENLDDTSNLITPWQRLVSCSYGGCDDFVFVDMIDAIATEDLDHIDHKTVHSLVETYQYWDGKNTVLFSVSLTKTNEEILRYNGGTISKWNEMIGCNGNCDNFNTLFFDLVEFIIS